MNHLHFFIREALVESLKNLRPSSDSAKSKRTSIQADRITRMKGNPKLPKSKPSPSRPKPRRGLAPGTTLQPQDRLKPVSKSNEHVRRWTQILSNPPQELQC
jgi:hypothetical protein